MTPKFPTVALSIRQPWAWLIIYGGKDVENRTWQTHLRGRVLVHASKGMTKAEYHEAKVFAELRGVQIPPFDDLRRGAVIGSVMITDCRREYSSPWFTGPWGLILADPQSVEPWTAKGKLGFFTPSIARAASEISEISQ